jgi:hypothetical protein
MDSEAYLDDSIVRDTTAPTRRKSQWIVFQIYPSAIRSGLRFRLPTLAAARLEVVPAFVSSQARQQKLGTRRPLVISSVFVWKIPCIRLTRSPEDAVAPGCLSFEVAHTVGGFKW